MKWTAMTMAGWVVWCSGLAAATDWPKFHGPNGDGTSSETGLRKNWGESGPAIPWSCDVGPGFGGVAVRDGQVFLLDRVLSEADVMRCLDLETGEEIWSKRYEAPGRLSFPGSRCVPTVEEEYVYALGGFGQLTCFSRESHEMEWMVHLVDEFGGELPKFGYSQSPVVYEDLVIVAPMGEEIGLVALDRFSGDEVWSTDGLRPIQASPMLVELHGTPQVLFVGASGEGAQAATVLRSYDPDTGDVLWSVDTGGAGSIVAPVRVAENRLLMTGRVTTLFDVQTNNDGFQVEPVFRVEEGSALHLVMAHDDHYYLVTSGERGGGRRGRNRGSDGGESNQEAGEEEESRGSGRDRSRRGGRGELGRLICVDSSGNEVWRSGDDAAYGSSNVLLADKTLYIQEGYSGALRVVAPSPDGYQLLAEADLFGSADARNDQQAWAPMALSDGRLLIRNQDSLKCVDLRGDS